MFLKRIDFENFKSFAGKISIPFMEGYTAITGPNGSGKSNIIDGMMFVMGTRSSKVLRAKKLTDMIYKGEKGGSAANYTKVTLVFDNTDRELSVDADEVRFMRQVKLGGNPDNYYSKLYINDNPSTTEEFDEILTKVRISADGYNMVQQGDVVDITTKGPIERRKIIDEISGISQFDADLQRAQTKKAITQTNIDTTNIVIKELQVQVSQLAKDKEDAQKYVDTKEKLDMAKAQQWHKKLEIASANVQTNKDLIEKNTKLVEDLKNKKASCITKIADYEALYRDVEAEIAAKMGDEYTDTKAQLEQLILEKGIREDRISNKTDENGELTVSITADTQTLQTEKSNFEEFNKQYNEKEVLIKNKKEMLQKAKDEVKAINDEMSNAGGESKTLTGKLTNVEAAIEADSKEEHDVRTKQATAAAIENTANEEVARLETDIGNIEFEIKDSEWNLDNYRKEVGPIVNISSLKERLLALQIEEKKKSDLARDLKSAVDRITGDYNRAMAEKKYADNASGNEAVRMVLQMRDTGTLKGIYGTVSELASVDKEYEVALSVAAGARMNSIIVENDAVAAEAINQLKKGGFGRATFLPLNKMMEGKPRAKAIMVVSKTLGYAIDLIKFKPEFRAAFWSVFGDTIVVKNMDEARAIMGGLRMVTLAGEIFEASGAMTGGTLKGTAVGKFGAGGKGKIEELTAQLGEARASYEDIEAQLNAIRDEQRDISYKISNSSAGSAEAQSKIAGMEATIKVAKERKATAEKTLAEKKVALAKAKSEREVCDQKLATLTAQIEGLKQEKVKIRKRLDEIAPAEINQRMQAARNAQDTLSGEIEVLTNELTDIKTKRYEAEVNCNTLQKSIDDDMAKVKVNEQIIEETKVEFEKYKIDVESYRRIIADMESKVNDLKEKKEKISVNKTNEANALAKTISDIETKEGLIATEQAQILIHSQEEEKCRAEIALIPFKVITPIPSEDELERTIKTAEATITKLGNVNLRAIDDYNAKKERLDGLLGEIKTLTAEMEELEKFTEDLNTKKKNLFMETYNGIATSFKEIFKEISGGGEAFISLENPEEPFQGGLILNAKPKSGKMLTLASLSGGEKSLTALAFIFAIQDCQPSPFYVFDEVDMFLDPINAEIVADYIKRSSDKTQFLQITHKPNVLPKSNHLVGVTKQSNGVSRVIMEPSIDELIKQDPDMQKEVA